MGRCHLQHVMDSLVYIVLSNAVQQVKLDEPELIYSNVETYQTFDLYIFPDRGAQRKSENTLYWRP